MEDLLVFLGLLFLGSFLFVFVAAIVLLVKTHLQSKRLADLNLQIQNLNRQVSWVLAQASGQNGVKETAPPPDPAHSCAAQPEPGNAFHFHKLHNLVLFISEWRFTNHLYDSLSFPGIHMTPEVMKVIG